mmetsp:Transcript_45761/g.49412  ORF Transcript_45761/g.49412 Transcript_45761/m.49412 type:complete len:514 (+) Transcript_45761:62-1603(+)
MWPQQRGAGRKRWNKNRKNKGNDRPASSRSGNVVLLLKFLFISGISILGTARLFFILDHTFQSNNVSSSTTLYSIPEIIDDANSNISSTISGNSNRNSSSTENITVTEAAVKFGFVHPNSTKSWCKEKPDFLNTFRVQWKKELTKNKQQQTICPTEEMLTGIPDDSVIFFVGDSLLRRPIETLCSQCGIHSCNLFQMNGLQGCELERGIKVVVHTKRSKITNAWSKRNLKLEVKVLNLLKLFLSSLYQPVDRHGNAVVVVDNGNDEGFSQQQQQALLPMPEWLKWTHTRDINTPFPTSCGRGVNNITIAGAASCPKLFVLTNLSILHKMYMNKWGDFPAWIGTFGRITNEKTFTDKIGGHYCLTGGSFICEGKRPVNIRKALTTNVNASIDACINNTVDNEESQAMIIELIRSGNPPILVNGGTPTTAVTNVTTEVLQEAIASACKNGMQNNPGIEYYSELVNAIARKQNIPMLDMQNLTKSEGCSASSDGVHYRDSTMWKQLKLWFQMFREQ